MKFLNFFVTFVKNYQYLLQLGSTSSKKANTGKPRPTRFPAYTIPDLRGFFQPNLFPEYTVFSTVCMYKTVYAGKTVLSRNRVLRENRVLRDYCTRGTRFLTYADFSRKFGPQKPRRSGFASTIFLKVNKSTETSFRL